VQERRILEHLDVSAHPRDALQTTEIGGADAAHEEVSRDGGEAPEAAQVRDARERAEPREVLVDVRVGAHDGQRSKPLQRRQCRESLDADTCRGRERMEALQRRECVAAPDLE
jgi:hypothetical protein